MKFPTTITVISTMLFVLAGCAKNLAKSEKARADAEAKVRAEAARKEMETLPKVFRTPEYFKKNEPAKTDTAQPKAEVPKK
jgi:hypothetical protein